MTIHPVHHRLIAVSTEYTGGSLDLTGPEGQAQFRRVDPHGVIMMYAGRQLSIPKDELPTVGHFFLAAGMMLGVHPDAPEVPPMPGVPL